MTVPPSLDQHRVALVNEIVAAVPGPGEREVFYGRLMDALFRTLDVKRGLLALVKPGDDGVRTVASRNEEQGSAGDAVEVSRTLVDRVIDTAEGLRLSNAMADPQLSGQESIERLRIRSVLCAPVPVRGTIQAVLYADNRSRDISFSKEDVMYLQLLGRLAGIALENLDHFEKLDDENRELRAALREGHEFVAASPQLQSVMHVVRRAARVDAGVLIGGETGSGKEVVARSLHALSPRCEGPFVAVNCAAIPDSLLEAELFGIAPKSGVAGAPDEGRPGKFERAHGGTLFLDEIGDMALTTQARILRALDQHEVERLGGTAPIPVDLRVVAATNKDLKQAVADGAFREDLFFRLNVVAITVPPLRERRDDVLPLAESFVRRFARTHVSLSPEARAALLDHDWPGNVRELRNSIERALVLCEGGEIVPEHLPPELGGRRASDAAIRTIDQVECEHIERVLAIVGGNVAEAARLLGVARSTLYVRMDKYGLQRAR